MRIPFRLTRAVLAAITLTLTGTVFAEAAPPHGGLSVCAPAAEESVGWGIAMSLLVVVVRHASPEHPVREKVSA